MAKFDDPVSLAVFESTSYGYRCLYTDEEAKTTDYAQISNWVTVTFQQKSQQEIVQSKVAAIDASIERKKQDLMQEISRLREEKQKLLAITHQSDYSMSIDSLPFEASTTSL